MFWAILGTFGAIAHKPGPESNICSINFWPFCKDRILSLFGLIVFIVIKLSGSLRNETTYLRLVLDNLGVSAAVTFLRTERQVRHESSHFVVDNLAVKIISGYR